MNTNNTPSPLLTMLQIIRRLGEDGGHPGDVLAQIEKISIPTLKRHIAEARHMGADIVSVRDTPTKSHVYEVRNWDRISSRVLRWLELESTRNLQD